MILIAPKHVQIGDRIVLNRANPFAQRVSDVLHEHGRITLTVENFDGEPIRATLVGGHVPLVGLVSREIAAPLEGAPAHPTDADFEETARAALGAFWSTVRLRHPSAIDAPTPRGLNLEQTAKLIAAFVRPTIEHR